MEFIDGLIAINDFFMLKSKKITHQTLEWYLNRSYTELNGELMLQDVKIDRSGEKKRRYTKYCTFPWHKSGLHAKYAYESYADAKSSFGGTS